MRILTHPLARLASLVLLLSAARVTVAQMAPDPTDLAKLSNVTFGWVSMSGVDPTLDLLTQFAPADIVLKDAGYSVGGEGVIGVMRFGDLEVTENFESALGVVGNGVVRVAHFGYTSNTAELQRVPGIPIETHGDALELSYTRRIGTTVAGISVIPQDSSTVEAVLPMPDGLGGYIPVPASVSSKAKFGVRAGTITPVSKNVRFGWDYSYQTDSSTAVIGGMPTPSNEYITRCGTVGMSWKPAKQTTVYGAYQRIVLTGGVVGHVARENTWFGVQQQVSPRVAIRANYLTHSPNVSVMWKTPVGIINASYTPKALWNARELLGDGDSIFASLAVGF